MILSAIVAVAPGNVIGLNNQLPWHLPDDLSYFQAKTAGRIIIMGRKTFESLPFALKGRFHIVISRNADYGSVVSAKLKDSTAWAVVDSFDKAVALSRELLKVDHPKFKASYFDEVFVIGGNAIFKDSLPMLNRLYLTKIEKEFPGDVFFPEWKESDFKLKQSLKLSKPFPHDYQVWERGV